MQEQTHIVFDGKKVLVSPNLMPVFSFLVHIENEILGLLGVRHQLESARKGILGSLKLIVHLMEKYPIEKDNLKIESFYEEDPQLLAEKLSYVQITRSEMIVLFSNLETIMALNAIYELNSVDETLIRNRLMDQKYVKKFLNEYVLNLRNPFYRENIVRLKFVTNKDIRDLRNSLTHFFSVRGLVLADESQAELARKMEGKLKNKINFISPKEMYELLGGVYKLLLIRWNDDYVQGINDFNERIHNVRAVIERDGAMLVYTKDLKVD